MRWREGTMDHDGDGRKGGSLPLSRKETTEMKIKNPLKSSESSEEVSIASEDEQGVVSANSVWERKDDGERVNVFAVVTGNVRFAPVGSAREDRMEQGEFLRTFSLVSAVPQEAFAPERDSADVAGNPVNAKSDDRK